MKTRYVSFAGQSLSVEYCPECSEVIDFLYADIEAEPVESPHATLTVIADAGELVLLEGKNRIYQGKEKPELALWLIRETIRCLIERNAEGMALHAAALSRNGKGILIPGQSGSGKTSLSTWLAARGFNYLTDEFVFIAHGSNNMQAFARPPNVKTRGIESALANFFDMDKHGHRTVRTEQVAMIPPRLLNPDNALEDACVDLILFPRFVKGAEFQLEKLTMAKAGLALMASLVNARNLAGHGFGEAVRLVRQTPSYRLEYGGFQQLDETFFSLLP